MFDTVEQAAATSFVNFDAQQAILPQLGRGERLLWAGQPRQGMFFQAYDVFMIPFSFAWGGFAMFWTFMAWRSGAPLAFVLFGTPFIAMGLFLMFGRFIADARSRAKTYYGVTSQRVMFIHAGKRQRVTSMTLKAVGEMSLTEDRNGRGTILFGVGPVPPQAAKAVTAFAYNSKSVPMFVQIERAREVHELIRRTQDEVNSAKI